MENLDWVEIAVAVAGPVLLVAFVYLRKIVKATETQLDDKILAALEEAVAESKDKPE